MADCTARTPPWNIFSFCSPIILACPGTTVPVIRSTCTSSNGSGWQVSVPGGGSEDTPAYGKLTFTDPEKIRELVRRGEAWDTILRLGRCWN